MGGCLVAGVATAAHACLPLPADRAFPPFRQCLCRRRARTRSGATRCGRARSCRPPSPPSPGPWKCGTWLRGALHCAVLHYAAPCCVAPRCAVLCWLRVLLWLAVWYSRCDATTLPYPSPLSQGALLAAQQHCAGHVCPARLLLPAAALLHHSAGAHLQRAKLHRCGRGRARDRGEWSPAEHGFLAAATFILPTAASPHLQP